MNIDDLTVKQIKEIAALASGFSGCAAVKPADKQIPFEIGKQYMIRTVTHINMGLVVDIVGKFLILENAAWVADTGRFHDFIKTGKLNEVEPWGKEPVFLNSSSIIDSTEWTHELPCEQK